MPILLFLKIHIYYFLNNPFCSVWFRAKCKPWFPLPSTWAWPQLMCLVENLWHREPWQHRAQMRERRNQSCTSCVHPQGSLQHLMPRLKVIFDWCLLQNLQTRSLRLFSSPFTTRLAKDMLLSLTLQWMEVGTISRRCLTFSEKWGQGWQWEQKPRSSPCGSTAVVGLLSSRAFATHWSSPESPLQWKSSRNHCFSSQAVLKKLIKLN